MTTVASKPVHSRLTRYAGTLRLARYALRRDRVIASVWIAVMVMLALASAAATSTLYTSEAERVQAAEALASSPATVALYGPILDPHSVGELAMTKMTVLYALFGALLFVILVRRHTRVDEDRGLAELLSAAPIGRDAPYAAAIVESSLLSVILGAGATLASIAGGLPAGGSVLFGLSWTGTGLVALGVAAVSAQISASARTCGAIAIGTLVALYVVRAAGDVAWHPMSWLSPFGWNTQLRAWSDPRLWVLALYPLTALVLIAVAGVLRGRRDLGGGLLPDRPGPVHGARWLATAFALAWRVHQSAIFVWTVTVAVLATLCGAIVPVASKLLESNTAAEILRRIGGTGAVEDALITAELGIIALGVTCFAISIATHAAEDERAGRTEEVRATAVNRTAVWIASSAIAYAGGAWLMLIAGGMLGLGTGESSWRVLGAAVSQIPAVWVTTAIAFALLAYRSRYAVLGWAVLGGFVVVGFLGESLNLPHVVTQISPYQHVPQLAESGSSAAPIVGLLVTAAVIAGAGWVTFSRRDIG
jgi:ABC-2 type transport system permease protein